MSRKPCLGPEAFKFLRALGKNNTTAWFHAHKAEYVSVVREPMAGVVAAINDELKSFASGYVTTRRDPLSRVNRDTRFSKDKSPYRTDVSVVFPRAGLEKHEAAGFFLGVAPAGIELIAGSYMPGPDQLRALRAHLDRYHTGFRMLAGSASLAKHFGQLQGESLVRVPAPYRPDHPAGDLLRMKQFYFRTALDADVAMEPEFVGRIVSAFRAATPFVTYVDKVLARG